MAYNGDRGTIEKTSRSPVGGAETLGLCPKQSKESDSSPLDLNLTAEELAFRDELRAWLVSHVPKDWEEWREKPMEESFPLSPRLAAKTPGGPLGRRLRGPGNSGGRSATLMHASHFLGRDGAYEAPPICRPAIRSAWDSSAPPSSPTAPEAQKKRYIPKILSKPKEICAAKGFSEPNVPVSDLAGLQTEARLDGDSYIVNGQKVWTSYGWVGNWCELVVRTRLCRRQTQRPHRPPGRHTNIPRRRTSVPCVK